MFTRCIYFELEQSMANAKTQIFFYKYCSLTTARSSYAVIAFSFFFFVRNRERSESAEFGPVGYRCANRAKRLRPDFAFYFRINAPEKQRAPSRTSGLSVGSLKDSATDPPRSAFRYLRVARIPRYPPADGWNFICDLCGKNSLGT